MAAPLIEEAEVMETPEGERMEEGGVAFLPKSVFGAMRLKAGQRVSVTITDPGDEGDEVEVRVMESEPVTEEPEHDMMSEIDKLPRAEGY